MARRPSANRAPFTTALRSSLREEAISRDFRGQFARDASSQPSSLTMFDNFRKKKKKNLHHQITDEIFIYQMLDYQNERTLPFDNPARNASQTTPFSLRRGGSIRVLIVEETNISRDVIGGDPPPPTIR